METNTSTNETPKTEVNTTPWWKSKTIRVNLPATVVALLALLVGEEWIQAYPQVTASLMFAIGLINLFLRTITNTALGR